MSDCSTMIIVMALVVQPRDDLEHLLHDDGREPERQLVDDQHLGLVHQRHREREHLLLAARRGRRPALSTRSRSTGNRSSTRSMRAPRWSSLE